VDYSNYDYRWLPVSSVHQLLYSSITKNQQYVFSLFCKCISNEFQCKIEVKFTKVFTNSFACFYVFVLSVKQLPTIFCTTINRWIWAPNSANINDIIHPFVYPIDYDYYLLCIQYRHDGKDRHGRGTYFDGIYTTELAISTNTSMYMLASIDPIRQVYSYRILIASSV
jgi:hypothetical protein